MRVLGIYDDHNCGCAIVEDGRILAALEEERLSRIKFHNGTTADGPPWRSLEKVLNMTGSGRANIDCIALAIAPPGELLRYVLRDLFKAQREERWVYYSFLSKSIRWDRYFLFYPYWYNWNRLRHVKKLLRRYDLEGIPVELVDHHTAHAASAYYTAGKDRMLVITLDGQGDGLSGSVFHGRDGRLVKKAEVPSYHSIGLFYNFITWMLGFKPNRHEGKITGLAAYGDPEKTKDVFRRFFRMDGPEFQYDLIRKVFQHAFPHRSNYPKIQVATNGLLDAYSPEDIAAGIQTLSESCVQQFVSHHVQKAISDADDALDLCMAGGVFANVKINQRVAELPHVRSVYIFPAMGDGGLCSGAALWAYYKHMPHEAIDLPQRRLPDVYLGPEYSHKEIEEALKQASVPFEYVKNIEDRIGELLARGHVVARFNGRMEYGPRALGNRSILYQPTDPSVNDWLNKKLKRTEFMPFAPVTLKEDAKNLYKNIEPNRFPAEFMTITFECTQRMRKECPATVHVDDTARPQLASLEINESYTRILQAYQKRTGLSTIINTSFNMHEEPIVCSPEDAIRAFNMGHLEYLAIGPFLASTKQESEE